MRGAARVADKNVLLMTMPNIDNLLRAIEQHQCDLYTPCSIPNGCKRSQRKINFKITQNMVQFERRKENNVCRNEDISVVY